MIEIWRDIKDYEGLYQVSNFGRVRNSRTGRLLKQHSNNKGYLQVRLYKNSIIKTFLVHRLVAMAFPDLVDWTEEAKGKPFEELQVNHKDEFDKANNRIDNLEWCTNDYNTHYGTYYERISNSLTNNTKKSKPVLQYTLDGRFIAEYPSAREAERQTGIFQNGISRCCLGYKKYSHSGGYIWKYKDYSLSKPSQSKSSIGR